MFDQGHYVPILKGRNGEYGALQVMSPDVKTRLTPVIEAPPIGWDFAEERPAKTIDEHLRQVSAKIHQYWGDERPLYLDLLWIPDRECMSDGSHPMTYVFDSARQVGLQLIPVIGLVRGNSSELACREIIAQDGRGVCLRLQREDFAESDLQTQVSALLNTLRVSATNADLILDLRALSATEGDTLLAEAVDLIRSVPLIERWRSFAMVATGFPENLIGLPPSDFSLIARLEWTLWHNVITRGRSLRLPAFGDYGITHPQPPEVDPRIMRPSCSIRYTTDNIWLIRKERNLRDYGHEQFHEACRQLIRRREYSGAEFSWGDQHIQDCAHERTGTGNLTTWRKVGTSHHLAFVTAQLANAS